MSSGSSDDRGQDPLHEMVQFLLSCGNCSTRRTDKLNSLVFGLPATSCALLLQHVEGGTDTSDESADEDVMVCMIVYIIR